MAELEALAKTIYLTCRNGVSKNLHDAYTWRNTAIVELSAPGMVGLTALDAILDEIAKNLIGVWGTHACLIRVQQTVLELRDRARGEYDEAKKRRRMRNLTDSTITTTVLARGPYALALKRKRS